ncbi:hypothetical protein [Nitrosopumilus sp.]|uniref:hypothetical protein n=1 Tax=Nitrosopumilus sp. TaxID=2024843 RepID=UPI0034A04F3A
MNEKIKKLQQRLVALRIFPNNKEVKILRERIKKQLARLEKQIPKKSKSKKEPNQSRSGKLKRYHNYIRQIRNNYPNLSYGEIRKQLTKRRQGKPSKIPDVIWQTPSG